MQPDQPTDGGLWGVVVPVKRLESAKSRLSSFDDAARVALVRAFARDVVAAAVACVRVGAVAVVTDDASAAADAQAAGAGVVADAGGGLDAAVDRGASALRARGYRDVAVVVADLPALGPEHLAEVLDAAAGARRGCVVDREGSGTTVVTARSGAPLRTAFGTGSAARHARRGAVPLAAPEAARQDVDTPGDLAAVLQLGVGAATAEALEQLGTAVLS